MGTFFIFLSFFLLSSTMASSEEYCSNSVCGKKSPLIQFPFRLEDRQHESCGYPGFDLVCSNQDKTVLDLGGSWGKFLVRNINYVAQEIEIYDEDNCIPKRLLNHNLNLSDTPFKGVEYRDFSFLNCSSKEISTPQFNPISCLSGTNYSVFATFSSRLAGYMTGRCQLIGKFSLPLTWPVPEFSSIPDLNEDLLLTWTEPYCGDCVARGGTCGFESNNITREVGCYNLSRRGLPRSVHYVITIGVGIPALMCAIGIACYVCARVKTISRGQHQSNSESSSMVMPQSTIVIMGLDEPTIESYPKVVLGESRRLPKPDDNTCPICLSEYRAKETLRTIPECKHCFHADCIDEWLRINATCPICRTSPHASPRLDHAT